MKTYFLYCTSISLPLPFPMWSNGFLGKNTGKENHIKEYPTLLKKNYNRGTNKIPRNRGFGNEKERRNFKVHVFSYAVHVFNEMNRKKYHI